MFFRLNTIRLCASLERAVDSKGFLPLERFPAAHQVTYNYYIGRLAIFDEDYVRFLSLPPKHSRHIVDSHPKKPKNVDVVSRPQRVMLKSL